MSAYPWYCVHCHLVPAGWAENPRFCPRCDGRTFRNGNVLITMDPGAGLLTRQALGGPTPADHQWVRAMRITWEERASGR